MPTPPVADDLSESLLLTLIDEAREFALYFLEGQKLIRDLALIHPVQGAGFAYFREVVLSVQPMIALLKGNEQFGFYLDSEAPYFRLKLETGHQGFSRCMLLPEDFQEFPENFTGQARVHKLYSDNRQPYQSILQVKEQPLRQVVNQVLRDSYQVNSVVTVSGQSDQSAMLHQLPPLPGKEEYEFSPEALEQRRREMEKGLSQVFSQALMGKEAVSSALQQLGFRLLAEREVLFHCPCSKEQMIRNIHLVYAQEREGLFEAGQESLELVCEYCKTRYQISRGELEASGSPLN
jgi:molecular chaperone Hsp33